MFKYLIILFFITLFSLNYSRADVFSLHKHSLVNIYNLNGIIIDNKLIAESVSEQLVTVNSDSLAGKIETLWSKGNQYYVKIVLANYDDEIKLSIFNMLGKEVLQIYKNKPLPRDSEYTFDSNLLPNGLYICVLEGKNFRDAEKFVVSR